MAEPDIWAINRKRAVMKVPVTSLCVQAGVGTRTYYEALDGTTVARPATIAKLNQALGRFKLAYAGDSGPLTVHAAWKGALLIAAFTLKTDPRAVLFSDPSRRATANPAWLEQAHARRLAYWLANGLMGFRATEIGRAAGVTKQAVSQGIKEFLALRDTDKSLDRACEQLEEVFFG